MDLGTVEPTTAHLPCHECGQQVECSVTLTMVRLPPPGTGAQLLVGCRAEIDTDPLWSHFYLVHGPLDPFDVYSDS